MKQTIKGVILITLTGMLLASCSNDKQATEQSTDKVAHSQSTQQDKKANDSVSDEDKQAIKKQLLTWLSEHEKDNGKAVSNRYFGSGSMSDGDWYAGTEDGEIQVSNRGEPGPKAFDVHTVTGAVTYTSNEGTTGKDPAANNLSNIEGYNTVADTDKPITKYLFADNGKVYEYQFTGAEDITLSSGFAPKDHTDKDPNLKPNQMFKVSENKALNNYYKKLLTKYNNE
ncbi:hypothetical protein [Staphylococcus arlettae]|uniref:hypothetical protein n=1 Tax=Staphylococcus arlettae TaxID=29378 RepID=UPI003518B057